jgi:hypothetical protein
VFFKQQLKKESKKSISDQHDIKQGGKSEVEKKMKQFGWGRSKSNK